MTDQSEKVEFWGIIDLFGHTRIAGHITEASIGGCAFIRCDVPDGPNSPALTKFFGNGAIYSMTPTSEELVRLINEKSPPAPISVYVPEIRQLTADPPHPQQFEEDEEYGNGEEDE